MEALQRGLFKMSQLPDTMTAEQLLARMETAASFEKSEEGYAFLLDNIPDVFCKRVVDLLFPMHHENNGGTA